MASDPREVDRAFIPAEGPPRVLFGGSNLSLPEARSLAARLGALVAEAEALGEPGPVAEDLQSEVVLCRKPCTWP